MIVGYLQLPSLEFALGRPIYRHQKTKGVDSKMLHHLSIAPEEQFVLLDHGERLTLYKGSNGSISAHTPQEVRSALAEIDLALEAGHHCAGYISYEAGLALEPRFDLPQAFPDMPLLWFGKFAEKTVFDGSRFSSYDSDDVRVGAIRPKISKSEYLRAFDSTKRFIQSGDVYQVNLTFQCEVELRGNAPETFFALRKGSQSRFGGLVHHDDRWLLSFSPELFFERDGQTITCRPMKGTSPRGTDPIEDFRLAQSLSSDPKQRAENLMIVDLMRNDLAKICTPGSVQVPKLFSIERYPSLFQMTSTVTGTLMESLPPSALIRALFPCGSITGAPKIRAMELIQQLENHPRGIYTGTIGAFSPDERALFNVSIRTLNIRDGERFATLGLGSGIVADSDPEQEWQECLTKSKFLNSTYRCSERD